MALLGLFLTFNAATGNRTHVGEVATSRGTIIQDALTTELPRQQPIKRVILWRVLSHKSSLFSKTVQIKKLIRPKNSEILVDTSFFEVKKTSNRISRCLKLVYCGLIRLKSDHWKIGLASELLGVDLCSWSPIWNPIWPAHSCPDSIYVQLSPSLKLNTQPLV